MAAAGANSQLNPLENAKRQFDEAASRLGLAEGVKEMLKKPRRTTIQHLPVVMDEKDSVSIFVSEGACVQEIVAEIESRGDKVDRDAFGHVKLEGGR